MFDNITSQPTIGKKRQNKFKFTSRDIEMVGAKRMKDLSDQVSSLEERLEHLSTDHETRINRLPHQLAESREEEQRLHAELLRMISALPSQLKAAHSSIGSNPAGRSQENIRAGSSNTPVYIRDNKGKGILPTPLPM